MGKLPIFYGKEGEDVETFVRDFKRACIGNNERHKEEWVMLLLDFFESLALTWYEEYRRDKRDVDTWESLTEVMIDHFTPDESYEKLMTEVTFLRQGEAEKVRVYAERVEKLIERFKKVLKKGRYDVSTTMIGIEVMLTKNFVASLKPQIRAKMKYERPSSKVEAIKIAVRMEESLKDDDSNLQSLNDASTSSSIGRANMMVAIMQPSSILTSSANPSVVDFRQELKNITETLADLKINVVQLKERTSQNHNGGARIYVGNVSRSVQENMRGVSCYNCG